MFSLKTDTFQILLKVIVESLSQLKCNIFQKFNVTYLENLTHHVKGLKSDLWVISEFRSLGGLISEPWGLILVLGCLVSDPRGLKPDPMDLKSDSGGLKSGRTEILSKCKVKK